jgi:hypothetical protein
MAIDAMNQGLIVKYFEKPVVDWDAIEAEIHKAVDTYDQTLTQREIFAGKKLFIVDQIRDLTAQLKTLGYQNAKLGEELAPLLARRGGRTRRVDERAELRTDLAAHPPATRYAIGGPLAAFGADPSATPVFGPDAFGTSAAVATTFFRHAAIFGAATGLDYPDALTGAVYMATGGRLGPVLLVNTHSPLPPTIAAYLGQLGAGAHGYVFGGPLAVAPDVFTALQAASG